MKMMLYMALLAVTAGAASAGTLDNDPGYAAYRHVVYGDPNVQVAPPTARPAQPQPGAYARYLMNLGWPREAALSQALRAGETATAAVSGASDVAIELTPYEVYQRSVLGWPVDTIGRDQRSNAMLLAQPAATGAAR